MKKDKTLVLGASPNPARYSFLAIEKLRAHQQPVIAVGRRKGNVAGVDISTEGKILFLEDLDEYLYHIDRMLVHLDRSGKLSNLAGLIVGDMSDMKDNAIPFGKTAYEIILEHTGKYNYPVCYNFPVGHEPLNLALICGREAILDVSELGATLKYN